MVHDFCCSVEKEKSSATPPRSKVERKLIGHHLEMTCLPQVWVLWAILPLRGIFSQVLTERLLLAEGQHLDLHCVNHKGHTSALEWRDPGGFAVFFNDWRVTRDGRYKLLHYSDNSLSVRLSNVTRHDEGLFTCLYYGENIGTKLVNVTVRESNPTFNVTEGNPSIKTTFPSNPTFNVTEGNPSTKTTFPSNPTFNVTEGNPSTQTTFPSNPTFNVTEGNPSIQTTFPSSDREVWVNNQTNMTYGGSVEEQAAILFPGLVSILLLALLIMVLLFVVKLWRAHKDWKKENNNASELPIESYRPKTSEAPCRLEKNICVIPWRNSEKYTIQESYPRTPKPSEGSQVSSVFEKELSHFIETDM